MFVVALLLSGQAVTPAASAKPSDESRVKCHVEEVTGSLVGRRRVCHTAAEWRLEAEASARQAQRMQENGLISPSHGS